jgi:hypothetical protein
VALFSKTANMYTLTKEKVIPLSEKMKDIALDITWSKIALRYFPGKSVPWFYNKLRGVDGNGGAGGFDFEERMQLKNALFDFAERIRNVAQNME